MDGSPLPGDTFPGLLGLEMVEAGPERVIGQIDIKGKHHQPYGVTHGGVYCSIVETLGSWGGALWAMEQGMAGVVGVNNNTDFLRPHRDGILTGVASPIHRGRTQQLWDVEITNEEGKLVARGQLRVQNLTALP
jgi:1,4-dihydroxy-2-naphthoyl-CoA hydrolase